MQLVTATSFLIVSFISSTGSLLCCALAPPRVDRRRPQSVNSRHVSQQSSSTFSKNGESPSEVCFQVVATSFTTSLSRRSMFSSTGLGLLLAVTPGAALAAPADTADDDEASQKAAAKERMAQRIAESKLKYRKPTDLVKDRKDNTDYSCVSATGSPCPEGLVPTAVQREIVGALNKLK